MGDAEAHRRVVAGIRDARRRLVRHERAVREQTERRDDAQRLLDGHLRSLERARRDELEFIEEYEELRKGFRATPYDRHQCCRRGRGRVQGRGRSQVVPPIPPQPNAEQQCALPAPPTLEQDVDQEARAEFARMGIDQLDDEMEDYED